MFFNRRIICKQPLLFGVIVGLGSLLLMALFSALMFYWMQLPLATEMVFAKLIGCIAVFIGALAATWWAFFPQFSHGLKVGGTFALFALFVAKFQGAAGGWQWLIAVAPPLVMGGIGGLLGWWLRNFVESPLTNLRGR